jgi:hypothetical protein
MSETVEGIHWRRLIAEAGAIVFSVLVALGVDEWREARQNRLRVERALAELADEARANHKRVTSTAAYHDSLIAAINEGRHVTRVLARARRSLPTDLSNGRVLRDAISRSLAEVGVVASQDAALTPMNDSTFMLELGTRRGRVVMTRDSLVVLVDNGISLRTAFIQSVAWETSLATQATLYMDYGVVSKASRIYQLQRDYQNNVQTASNILFSGRFEVGLLYDLSGYERSLERLYTDFEAHVSSADSAKGKRQ